VKTFLTILLVILSLALIGIVLLQQGRSAGLGAISGGAEQLFGKQKARGVDALLHRITIIIAVLFFLLALTVAYFV
jgi:preprotein translocase subunit SecG